MTCPLCNSKDSEYMLEYKDYPFYIKPVSREYRDNVPLLPLRIVLCNSCGFVYQEITFDLNELSKIYEIAYESYHSPVIGSVGGSLASDFLEFLENCTDPNDKKVLEIGCFDGYFLSLLRDKHSCDVIGCDPSHGAKIAESIGVKVIQDYFSPRLFHETFDMIVLRGLLEHVLNPTGFLKDVETVTSKNGIIAIEVPNLEYSLRNGVIGDFFHEHLSYFTKNSLTNCLSLSGFEPVKIDDDGYYVRAIFKKSGPAYKFSVPRGEASKIKKLSKAFNENVERLVRELTELSNKLSGKEVYLYGGGGHTIGLLSKTRKFLGPKGVIDGDPSKVGKYIPGFNLPVYPKKIVKELDPKKSVIIVSSKILQDEIINELRPYIVEGLKVVKLYPTVEYVKPRAA